MRRSAVSLRALGRRHLSWALYSLAVVGVPVTVVLATRSADAVGFWIVALFWVAASVYGACVAVFVLFLALSPIVLALARVFPDRTDTVTIALAKWSAVGVSLSIYIAWAQLGDASAVSLPGPWANLGALIVVVSATMASWWLWRLAGRYRMPRRRRGPVPEPAEDFWSAQPVVGWRAWTWDGTTLGGVYASWPEVTLEAGCRRCGTAPTWTHDCGIYATKEPSDVQKFHGGDVIVGRVEMWGDVIEHERGYRASHARIVELWLDRSELVESVGAAYPGVRIRPDSPRAARR